MKTFRIDGSTGSSTLMVGERLKKLEEHLPGGKTVIITDTNVRGFYQNEFPACGVIEIGVGEKIKTLATVMNIYESLVDLEADRSSFIVGVGGGIVCDIAGFVASTFLRGVRFGFVASTLLAQVDASVGGKNGVNLGGYKNMVGVFNQPEFVICDLNLLKTMDKKEVLCGMAEIVKHAAIADAEMFSFLEENHARALELDQGVIERLVYDSIRIKSEVVNKDEKEAGERRKLNFGHTIGHAIEKTAGVPHGEAVSAGMVAAARLSVQRGLLNAKDEKRLYNLLEKIGLPTSIPTDEMKAVDALRRDKKREGSRIHFVLLDGIGKAVVDEISIAELERAMSSSL
ncbi:MAG: 3-dehydroquinate synthase [Desulfobacterales bacterium]|nr:3-dehydroquinate synthase [Desulfobacterales bacterium]